MRQVAISVGLIAVFDVVGVVLTLGADLLGMTHRRLETSSPLGYVIWFVTGVFCSVAIYGAAGAMEDTPQARRRGRDALVVTAVCAVVLAAASSPFWGGGAAVAPDSGPITIGYLLTVVAGLAWWRFGVFSGAAPADVPAAYIVAEPVPVAACAPEPVVPEPPTGFRPAGVLGTCAWVLGVPILLFLVASFFVLAPFGGLLRPWTGPILTGTLVLGAVWGLVAARRETARDALLALLAPVLIGSVLWLLTALLASPLVGLFGLPDRVATIACLAAFCVGFVMGLTALAGWVGDLIVRVRRPGGAA